MSNRKKPAPLDLDEIIKQSHKRCEAYGVDKKIKESINIISGKKLDDIIKKNQSFIDVAYPYMKLLYEFLEGTGFLVDLTDADGCIIAIVGDSDVIKTADDMGMRLGTDMSEKSSGTNSIGTALHEKRSIQMAKDQHFIETYHIWTCSCAPVRNVKGEIIGSINVTGFYDAVHPHTLGFVFTMAELIENELRNIERRAELNSVIQFNETMSDAVGFGLVSASIEGKIKTVNNKACDLFDFKREELLAYNGKDVFQSWYDFIKNIDIEGVYSDECVVKVNHNKKKKFNTNVYPVRNSRNEITDFVISIKEMSNIYKMVNKYSGKNAYYSFNDIVFKSAQMEELIAYGKTVAKTPSTVTIQGESGTGKEIFAQALHNESNRKNEPFIAINCGAIPRNLIESELFGYEKGAFTSARTSGMPGKFELANKGTIFLDEIGEMPMDMQVNLLRVLQERQVCRIGGTKSIDIDVRVIAATNRSLNDEIKSGNFREDLYYRLNVIPISIPPLRDRKDDIGQLIDHFIIEKSKTLDIDHYKLSDTDYERLVSYSWPGNVRELENVIENFIINGSIRIDTSNDANKLEVNEATNSGDNLYNMQSLDDWEKIAIEKCIKHCNGNMSKAAAVLGINRSTLYKKLKSYA